MRKNKVTAIVAGLLAGLMLVGTVTAANVKPSAGNNKFVLDGQTVNFDSVKYNGANYLKLRDITKALNIGVDYDEKTGTVTINRYDTYEDPFAVEPTPKNYTSKAPYKYNTLAESDPKYWQAEWETQVYNYKLVRNYPTLYTAAAWDAAQTAGNLVMGIHPEAMSDVNKEQILAARDAIAALANSQIKPFEGIGGEAIYIWDEDNMPVTTSAKDLENNYKMVTYDGSEASYDNPDYRPFIIPYLLDNPGTAKGTIITVSGGGYSSRSNAGEAYKVAPGFNQLGYNCFILQRRVAPYNQDDIVMDLQRAIRVVKYYAKDWGIDLENTLLATAGWSGGSGTVVSQMNKFYGDITPDQFDKNYKCDKIDKMNSDVDVAMPIYGPGELNPENPNLPYLFLAIGSDDFMGYEGYFDMYRQADELGLKPELQIYSMNGHGFGPGNKGTTSMLWMQSADMYMQKVMGYAEVSYEGEIPEKYTMTQTIMTDWLPGGEVPATAYLSADGGSALFTFFAFGDNIMVEFLLIGGRPADCTYDSVGYFGQEGPKFWGKVDPSAWVPYER